jgi:hypothetical protein
MSIRQGHGMPVIKRWDSSDMDSIYKMSFFVFSLEYVPKGHGRVVKWASFLRPSWNIINKNRNYSGPWEPGDLNSPPRMRRGGRDAVEDGVVRQATDCWSRATSNHPCRGPASDSGIPSLSKEGSPLPMIVNHQKGPE